MSEGPEAVEPCHSRTDGPYRKWSSSVESGAVPSWCASGHTADRYIEVYGLTENEAAERWREVAKTGERYPRFGRVWLHADMDKCEWCRGAARLKADGTCPCRDDSGQYDQDY